MKTARVVIENKVQQVQVNDQDQIQLDGKDISLDKVTCLPPVEHEVICVALNYAEHVKQVESAFHEPPHKSPPTHPVLFIKPLNTLNGHLRPVQKPDGVEVVQAGPALAVVIGKKATRVKAEDAMDYVQGYTLFNDFTLPEISYFRPAIVAKCYDSFGPLGPYIVDKDDIDDPHNLMIRTLVNGEVRQESNTSGLIRTIPELIESITEFKTLPAGSIIASGFPPGRVDVNTGDVVSIEIEKIGCLSNTIVSEEDYYSSLAEEGVAA